MTRVTTRLYGTVVILLLANGCWSRPTTSQPRYSELRANATTHLGTRENSVLSVVVDAILKDFPGQSVLIQEETLSGNEILICGNELAEEFLLKQFQVDLDSFCKAVSKKRVSAHKIGGSSALAGEVDANEESSLFVAVSEPAFASDNVVFVYAIVSDESESTQSGGEWFFSLIRNENGWTVQKSRRLGIP